MTDKAIQKLASSSLLIATAAQRRIKGGNPARIDWLADRGTRQLRRIRRLHRRQTAD